MRGVGIFAWGEITWKLVVLRVNKDVDGGSEMKSAVRFLKYDGVEFDVFAVHSRDKLR